MGVVKLVYSENFNGRDLRLMEAPKEVVSYVLGGHDLNLIGPKVANGDVVLCTADKTFSVKRVETSNSLFLIPPSTSGDGEFTLECAIKDYYEVKPIEAKTDKIAEILKSSLYEGSTGAPGEGDEEGEQAVDEGELLTRAQLEEQVQASKAELEATLEALGVVEVRGKMRLLDVNLRRACTRELLDTVMVNKWSMDSVDEKECRSCMVDTDHTYLWHALHSLGTHVSGSSSSSSSSSNSNSNSSNSSGAKVWCLDKEKVAKATAHILFQNRSSKDSTTPWPTDDFLLEWSSRIPDSGSATSSALSSMAAPDKELLSGIAMVVAVEGSKGVEGYRYVPASQVNLLPKAEDRFKHMLAIKPKYTQEELAPYCEGLYGNAGQPRSIAELLLKYAKFVDNVYILKA
jgi:sister chromatid cohesion protein DCC1